MSPTRVDKVPGWRDNGAQALRFLVPTLTRRLIGVPAAQFWLSSSGRAGAGDGAIDFRSRVAAADLNRAPIPHARSSHISPVRGGLKGLRRLLLCAPRRAITLFWPRHQKRTNCGFGRGAASDR